MNIIIKRIAALIFALVLIVLSCGCSDNKTQDNAESKSDITAADSSGAAPQKIEPITKPSAKNKRLNPDLASVQLATPSDKTVYSKTVEECVARLAVFANPNGNEYDAVALLGAFRYPDKTEDELLEQFKTASAEWHKDIVENVGEKCVAKISLAEKNILPLSDAKAEEWKSVNSAALEEYANVKCVVTTNYSSGDVKISIDLAKVDGSWYLAYASGLDKIRNVMVTEIFR